MDSNRWVRVEEGVDGGRSKGAEGREERVWVRVWGVGMTGWVVVWVVTVARRRV